MTTLRLCKGKIVAFWDIHHLTNSIDYTVKRFWHYKLRIISLSYVSALFVQDHIFKLMKNDSYSRYIRSDMYKEFLQGSKKKVIQPTVLR